MFSSMAILPSTTYAQANANQQIADEIMGIVKAQWAAEIADPGNLTESYKNISDDYTEFNGTMAGIHDINFINAQPMDYTPELTQLQLERAKSEARSMALSSVL